MRHKSLLYHWYAQRAITDETMPQALESVTHASFAQWLRFLNQLLLGSSVMCFGSSLICFIAYNWHYLTRLSKLALLEAIWLVLMIVPLALLKYVSHHPAVKHAVSWSSLLTAIATGGVLAYIGQAYQQGADDWQLFAAWSVLSLPWIWLGRSDWHIGLLALLLNLSLFLWFQVNDWPLFQQWFPDETFSCLLWWQVLLNLVLHLTLLFLNRRKPVCWGGAKFSEALAGLAMWVFMLIVIADAIFTGNFLLEQGNRHFLWSWSQSFWWLISVVLLVTYWNRHCLYGLALLMFAQIVYSQMWLLRWLNSSQLETYGYLLMSASSVGMSVAVSLWLLKLQRRFEEQP
ncbi:DUF2157 domain-containing protein [Shewanella yunxiaonensis]|uniref:DUF2157 domain-containing protein n=1 Tax=Shewanella yunxiaonensis TaxID=2829809 RepID=A0ABX7YXY3_9GAMM|nr:DUF2157 domain-containing protein [Shewanella yunxiaonensis]QUN07144.1 DUF2157 domain-containing protein [Shewanella yunxiaonensis]